MHAEPGAVVAARGLGRRLGRMALIAERLPPVGAQAHAPLAFEDFGQGHARHGKVNLGAAVEESQRRRHDRLDRRGRALVSGAAEADRRAGAVHLVAGKAGNRGLAGQCRLEQPPRACGRQGRYQIADAAGEVHAVAPQAIIVQQMLAVVLSIQKDVGIGRRVRAAEPGGVLALVAAAALAGNPLDVPPAHHQDLLRHVVAQVPHQAAEVTGVKAELGRQRSAMAVGARDRPVRRAGPLIESRLDLVAAGAACTAGCLVVDQSGARKHRQRQERPARPRQAALAHAPLRREARMCAAAQ